MLKRERNYLFSLLVISLAIFFIACLPYLYILDFSFTGVDTVPTIAAARIDSINQIFNVFTRELRGGIADMPVSYYRPLTLVTYSLDYLVWGWEAKGYHITDLLLHGLAAIAVFWMILVAFERKLWEAFVVALLFVLHPATIEVVPAISRRQEPLLMIGCALALIGAHGLPRMRAWIIALFGTLICITSVERGLFIPGLLFIYILIFKNGLVANGNPSIRDKLISTIKYTVPFGLLAVFFYITRSVLFQNTGILFSLRSLISTPIEFFISVFYSQQFIALRWPNSLALKVLLIILGYFLFMAVLVIFWKSKQKKLYIILCLWIILFTIIIAIAGQNFSWYTYTIVVPISLIFVLLLEEGIGRIRNSGGRDPLGYLNVALSIGMILLIVTASPTFRKYPAWKIASQQTQTVLPGILKIIQSAPPNTEFVFINIPSQFRENNSDFLVTKAAAILEPYSLKAWFDVQNVKNKIVVLGSSYHIGEIRSPEMELKDSGLLNVYFSSPYSNYSKPEFAWPPQELEHDNFRVYIYDGSQFIEVQQPVTNSRSFTHP
jgi:hypothetical protein